MAKNREAGWEIGKYHFIQLEKRTRETAVEAKSGGEGRDKGSPLPIVVLNSLKQKTRERDPHKFRKEKSKGRGTLQLILLPSLRMGNGKEKGMRFRDSPSAVRKRDLQRTRYDPGETRNWRLKGVQRLGGRRDRGKKFPFY